MRNSSVPGQVVAGLLVDSPDPAGLHDWYDVVLGTGSADPESGGHGTVVIVVDDLREIVNRLFDLRAPVVRPLDVRDGQLTVTVGDPDGNPVLLLESASIETTTAA